MTPDRIDTAAARGKIDRAIWSPTNPLEVALDAEPVSADTMRSWLAALDAAYAEIDEWRDWKTEAIKRWEAMLQAAEAERDALRAEVARLRGALAEANQTIDHLVEWAKDTPDRLNRLIEERRAALSPKEGAQ